ncbi:MFS transporter [Streptomyces sp. NPDC002952]|uniref:MFS transporter n=1 Tax=Streptomyces sp. NPDC002952 TaxID=3364673 RepID=UPI0036CF7739
MSSRVLRRFASVFGAAATTPLLCAGLVGALGTGMTTPLLVVYLHSVRGLPLGLSAFVIATVPLVSLGGNPLGGRLADCVGARTTAAIGLLIAGGGTACLSAVTTVLEAVGSLGVLGLGVSLALPAQNALLSHAAAPARWQSTFAAQAMLNNVGYGAGGCLSALMIDGGQPAVFHTLYLLDGLSFVAAALLILRSPYLRHEPPSSNGAPPSFERTPRSVLPLRNVDFRRLWLLSTMVYLCGFSQLHSGFPGFATAHAHVSGRTIGMAFVANTFLVVLAQWPALHVAERDQHRALSLLFLCAAAAVSVVYLSSRTSHVTSVVLVMAAPAVLALAEALYSAIVPALVNHVSPVHLRGQYNGTFMLSGVIGNLVGPAISGLLVVSHPLLWLLVLAGSLLCVLPILARVGTGRSKS